MKKENKRSYLDALTVCLATGFWSGFSPKAPGTAGTLVAVFFTFILLTLNLEPNIFFKLLLTGILLVVSLLVIRRYLIISQSDESDLHTDPQEIVIDEIAGYAVTICLLPWSTHSIILGFFLFRLFDMTKPGPVRALEKLPGAYGILLDDIAAGMCACISSHIILSYL